MPLQSLTIAIRHEPPVRQQPDRRLIETRLTAPPAPVTLVPRPRLDAQLEQAAHGLITIVNGPAGSGKTTALQAWTARTARPVAWLTVDRDDNRPGRLWAYLLAALDKATALGPDGTGVGPPARPFGRIGAPTLVDTEFLNELACALQTLSEPVVLVLDDAHLLHGYAADSLALLVRHRPPRLRLVLSSRYEPPLPLGRLRIGGDVAEITADDLAFTTAETRQLWAQHDRRLPHAQAAVLVEQTGGWPAGLRMALSRQLSHAGSAGGEVAPDAADLGRDPCVVDYLRAEVLADQPPASREFLMLTACLDRVTAELADTVTGRSDASRLLQRLHQQRVFVRLGPQPHTYHYNPVFRQFLRDEAEAEYSTAITQVHRRAARWYARKGMALEAAQHAIKAGDPAYAAGIVVQHGVPHLAGAGRQALHELVSHLPATGPDDDPAIATVLALTLADQHDTAGATHYAQLAGDHLATVPAERRPLLRALLDLTATLLSRHHGDLPAFRADTARLADLLDTSAFDTAASITALHTIARSHLGVAQFYSGDLAAAETTLASVAATAHDDGLDLCAVDALSHLALLLALQGRLSEADSRGRAAIRLAGIAGWRDPGQRDPGQAVPGLLALTLVAWLRGDQQQALRHLSTAGNARRHELDAFTGPAMVAVRAEIVGLSGDAAEAQARVHAARARIGNPPGLLRDWLAIVEARLRLRDGEPDAALSLTEEPGRHRSPLAATARVTAAQAHLAQGASTPARDLPAKLRARGLQLGIRERIDASITDVLAAARLGHEGAVRIALSEAITLAAGEGYRQPFADAGPELTALLTRHRDLLGGGRHPEGDPELPQASTRPDRAAASEQITERENMILRYLPTLLTTSDIARELCVSPNTVKTHVKSLYRKLAVGSRRDAVHRARTLNLL